MEVDEDFWAGHNHFVDLILRELTTFNRSQQEAQGFAANSVQILICQRILQFGLFLAALMVFGLRNDLVIQLELSIDDHGVHVGDFKQFGGLQAVESKLGYRNYNLYSLFI